MADPPVANRLRPGDHVCWTFNDDSRRLTVVAGQVRDGLACGQKVLCYTDTPAAKDFAAALGGLGTPVDEAVAVGQLRIRSATETYRAGGQSSPASMVAAWMSEVELARYEGWPGVRVLGDMTWAARSAIGVERLAWYEAQVNRIFADGYGTAICFYDRRLFPATELQRISAAHPATAEDFTGHEDDWQPLLRFRRTTDPVGLRLSGQADASNRGALTAVLTGLCDEVTGPAVPPTVDVSELTFVDGAAAHLLIRTAHATPSGLRLAGCSPGLVRLIGLVADHVLPAGLVLEPA